MSKTPHQKRVEQFMRLAKQEIPSKPTIPDDKTARLRAALIMEEALETVKALGCEVLVEGTFDLNKGNYGIVSVREPNLEEICDGVADLSVVSTGTLSACGVPDKKLLELVDQNNLDKFGEGHSWRSDGKLLKSPNHKKPDLKGFLESLS